MTLSKRDRIITPQQITFPLIVFAFGIALVFAQVKSNPMLLGIIAVFPFVLMLATKPDILAVLFIATYFSNLHYYRMPMNLMLYQMFMVAFVAISVAKRIVSKNVVVFPSNATLGWLSMGWILLIMWLRGHAISQLGGGLVGGAAYVHLFIAFGVYIFSSYLNLSERQWRIAIFSMMGMIMFSVLMGMLVVVTRGRFYYPMMFIRLYTGLIETFTTFHGDAASLRLSILHPLVIIYLFPAFLWSYKGVKNRSLYMLFFSMSLMSALFSGYRNRLIHAFSFICIFTIMTSKRPFKTALYVFLGGLLFLFLLVANAERMPYGVQRVLTIIPGVKVQAEAEISGAQTMLWRQVLWSMVRDDMPKYILVGRGFGFSLYEYENARQLKGIFSVWRQAYSTYIGGHMHQGVLDMLLFLGMPGMMLFTAWWICEMIRHVKLQHRPWNSETLKRYHLALTVYFIVCVSQFLLYQGGIQHVLMDLTFQMALLNALYFSDISASNKALRQLDVINTKNTESYLSKPEIPFRNSSR